MLSELLQDRAALYVSGAMTPEERDSFAVLLEFDPELRAHVGVLEEAAAVTLVSAAKSSPAATVLPGALKARILEAAAGLAQEKERDALVITDAAGRFVWVNDAFTALCGHTLPELKGRKPGEVLQGPETEPASIETMRAALNARRSCHVQLTNYHKDGSRYRADVRISPFLDDEQRPVYFVARERRLADAAR